MADEETLAEWRRKAALRYARHRDRLIAKRLTTMSSRRLFVNQLKLDRGSCADCGIEVEEWNTVIFAFDHRDPTSKALSIGHGHGRAEETIRKEVDKCDLVCHNCHAIRTFIIRDHAAWTIQRLGYESKVNATHQLCLFEETNDG